MCCINKPRTILVRTLCPEIFVVILDLVKIKLTFKTVILEYSYEMLDIFKLLPNSHSRYFIRISSVIVTYIVFIYLIDCLLIFESESRPLSRTAIMKPKIYACILVSIMVVLIVGDVLQGRACGEYNGPKFLGV